MWDFYAFLILEITLASQFRLTSAVGFSCCLVVVSSFKKKQTIFFCREHRTK